MKWFTTICCLTLFLITGNGQTVDLQQKVTFHFSNIKLGEAITDIGASFDINFSYSKDYIPVDELIDCKVKNKPLTKALDKLFKNTGVVYSLIGDQVVLKMENNFLKTNDLGSLDKVPEKQAQVYTITINEFPVSDRLVISSRETSLIKAKPVHHKVNQNELKPSPDPDLQLPYFDDNWRAQVSLIPEVGTNATASKKVTNNISVNLFWGESGGVDGVEIGGFMNTVNGNVNGVQLAGLINVAEGDVRGSTWMSKAKMGVQIAGLINVGNHVHAVQVAGAHNSANGYFSGVQIGGLGNYVGGEAKGVQFAGLYNVTEGNADTQFAGLVNVAQNISGNQVSGILNKARYVDGHQIGIINICDSISKQPIGLFNIVKGGINNFNRFQVYAGELLYANLGYNFGVRSFYNTIRIGGRFGEKYAWGIGYGIGTLKPWGNKKSVNIELEAMQIHEGEMWTKELNLITSLKLLIDFKLNDQQSIFIGPDFNIMISKLYNPDIHFYGSQLAPYSLFKNKPNADKPTQINHWFGFKAGFRF